MINELRFHWVYKLKKENDFHSLFIVFKFNKLKENQGTKINEICRTRKGYET